jgi:predicted membrane-bound spermidine synthase
VRVIPGDARRSLESSTSTYDLIVLDAFTSDAIPTHLLTVEFFESMRARLTADGIAVFHVSNRHLDLKPVVLGLAEGAGWRAYRQRILGDGGTFGTSVWMAVTADPEVTRHPATRHRFVPYGLSDDIQVTWRDDFTNLLAVLGKP